MELPDSIGNATSLKTLDLSGCSSLKTLPSSVGKVENLIILALKLFKSEEASPCY